MKKYTMLLLLISIFCILGCGSGGIGGGSGSDDVQYAALGASDATGIGARPLTNGYVYLIEEGIENSGKSTNLLNYGIPDVEIGGILDVEIKLLDKGNKPDVVTLFTGTNDVIAGAVPSHFQRDLSAILNHLRKIEGVRLFVADLPNLTQLPRFKNTPDDDVTLSRLQTFNAIIHEEAARYNAQVIKLSEETPSDALVSDDGLHPNNEGYRRIADLFLQEILPTL